MMAKGMNMSLNHLRPILLLVQPFDEVMMPPIGVFIFKSLTLRMGPFLRINMEGTERLKEDTHLIIVTSFKLSKQI